MNKIGKLLNQVFMYLVLTFTVLISLYPIIWIVLSSFKNNAEILGSPFSLPSKLDFSVFRDVFIQYNFFRFTMNSLIVAGVSVVVALFIFCLASYVLAKYDFKGKTLFYLLFTITLLVPVHAKAQPIFSLILKMNLYDTKLGLILVYLSNELALAIFILTAGFKTIPKSLDEAALIDGATFWQTFYKINLPLVSSAISTAGVLMFLTNWNEYFFALLLTSGPANRTLPLSLAFFTETFSYNYTEMFAALVIVVLPGILIYTVAQEKVQQSVASSGIKG